VLKLAPGNYFYLCERLACKLQNDKSAELLSERINMENLISLTPDYLTPLAHMSGSLFLNLSFKSKDSCLMNFSSGRNNG
jgi:hypothetical protein